MTANFTIYVGYEPEEFSAFEAWGASANQEMANGQVIMLGDVHGPSIHDVLLELAKRLDARTAVPA